MYLRLAILSVCSFLLYRSCFFVFAFSTHLISYKNPSTVATVTRNTLSMTHTKKHANKTN